jgi:hypothetical protein
MADTLTIELLERWAVSGGHWQILDLTERRAVVQLCTCTGEPLERLRSRDPELIAQLAKALTEAHH